MPPRFMLKLTSHHVILRAGQSGEIVFIRRVTLSGEGISYEISVSCIVVACPLVFFTCACRVILGPKQQERKVYCGNSKVRAVTEARA